MVLPVVAERSSRLFALDGQNVLQRGDHGLDVEACGGNAPAARGHQFGRSPHPFRQMVDIDCLVVEFGQDDVEFGRSRLVTKLGFGGRFFRGRSHGCSVQGLRVGLGFGPLALDPAAEFATAQGRHQRGTHGSVARVP